MLHILTWFRRWRFVVRIASRDPAHAEGALILARRVIAEQRKVIERQKRMIEKLQHPTN
jgi:hypothetical protein